MNETTAHILRQIAQFPSDQHFTALKTAMYFGMRHDYGSFPLFPTVEAVDSGTIARAADYVNAGGSLEDFLSIDTSPFAILDEGCSHIVETRDLTDAERDRLAREYGRRLVYLPMGGEPGDRVTVDEDGQGLTEEP